ncbi:MAG: hypothetical protein ACLQHK_06635 [Gallionellaceae bacterium]
MALDALLARLEGRGVTAVTSEESADVTPNPSPIKGCTPVTPVTPQNDDTASDEAAMLRCNSYREARRQKVIGMLEADPDAPRAIYADTHSDPDDVIVAIAVRHVATFEMLISKSKYDPWRLLELIERLGQTTH